MPELEQKTVNRKNIVTLAEAGIMLALAVVLNAVTFYEMPQGGSISLFGYLPLFLFSVRHGVKKGLLLCAVYGLIDFIMKPYFVNVAQFFIDYIFAYGSLGLAGLAFSFNQKFAKLQKMRINPANVAFCLLGGIVRIAFAVISGIIFYADGKPFWPAFDYSFTYNFPYGIVNTLLAILGIILLQPALERFKRQ